MKIKRKIEVTTGNIRKGVASEVYHCPVALAIKRTLKIDNVYVAQDMTSFRFNDTEFDLSLPVRVINWIDRFDDRKEVKPFSFMLRGDSY